MSENLTATVRMYRLHELGDCFLITFRQGARTSRMLIDCGSFRNSAAAKARLGEIVDDIGAQLDGAPLDVVIGTHQHNDHVSGFLHCEEAFRTIGVEQVWLPWLDDPQDALAREIGVRHNNLTQALYETREKLQRISGRRRKPGIIDDVLGFYGASANEPPKTSADAIRLLKTLGRRKPKYLKPGTVLDLPGMSDDFDNPPVRVYVLGPPRNEALLRNKDPAAGESYDHALAAAGMAAGKFLSALNRHAGMGSHEEEQYPFNASEKREEGKGSPKLEALVKSYRARKVDWRRIDDDWLNQADALALFMDSFTNNSSLVLAIELVDSGKILLFAADAQTGNWKSWWQASWRGRDVDVDDLLARTVLYKVGHHGSHNATLLQGLEKMSHSDLIALIPVHKKDPNIAKENGWKMPARNLRRRLIEKTSNRVLEMDGQHAKGCDPKKEPARTAWEQAGVKPRQTELFIEVTIHDG